MKIENRSHEWSHKLDGIGVGRIRTFLFLSILFATPSLTIQWKLGCRSRKQKRKNQPIARPRVEHCHWFIFSLLLATPTTQFSLDRKRRSHKQSHCSASDSVGLIFTKSYRSTLLITTPPSPLFNNRRNRFILTNGKHPSYQYRNRFGNFLRGRYVEKIIHVGYYFLNPSWKYSCKKKAT